MRNHRSRLVFRFNALSAETFSNIEEPLFPSDLIPQENRDSPYGGCNSGGVCMWPAEGQTHL